MRLRQRDLTPVTFRQPLKTGDSKTYAWAPGGTAAMAAIQPLKSLAAAQVYGKQIETMKQMFYQGKETLGAGIGVCVDVKGDEACDYRIAAEPEGFSIQRCTLEWIPAGKRQ